MKNLFTSLALVLTLVAASFATSKHAKGLIRFPESDRAVATWDSGYTVVGATDSLVGYGLDTLNHWFGYSNLTRIVGPGVAPNTAAAVAATRWADSLICPVMLTSDTSKTDVFVVQATLNYTPTQAQWTTVLSTNMSATTTKTLFRIGTAYMPGYFFRWYIKSSGGATATVQSVHCYAK